MTVDLADLKQRVGQRLGVVPTAGFISAEDGSLILEAYETLYAELFEHNLAPWDADEITSQYEDILIGMTAARVVDEFTIAEPRRSAILLQSAFGLPNPSIDERRLRKLVATPAFDDPVSMDFY